MRRLTPILTAILAAVAVLLVLAVTRSMTILSSEASVKHSCVKINSSLCVVTFTLSSPREGRYRYQVSCNHSVSPLSWSDEGDMWAGGAFTYTLWLELKPYEALAVNVKIWWEGRLMDEVTHYVRADVGQ